MDFKEHEIWDRSVPETAAPAEPTPRSEPSSGRLYAAAGVTGHPDAIVALPHHTRNFVSVAELPDLETPQVPPAAQESSAPPAAAPAPQAPIIADPAIAEVLASTTATETDEAPSFDWAQNIEVDTEEPFKDWYAEPAAVPSAPAAPVKTGRAAQQASDAAMRARTQLQDLGERVAADRFDLRKYALVAFVVTAGVGAIDAFIGGTLGILFGAALIASTAFGSFKLERADAWVGWVMPAYIAIAAILVAGQFADGAPGFSLVGQILLVGTTLITIAPWLAIATIIGAVAPRFRKH